MHNDSAHILISRACANNCLFCAVAGQRKKKLFPTRDQVVAFIRDVHRRGVKHLVFSGLGEPTDDPFLDDYLLAANALHFERMILFTNGHGVTKKRAGHWRDRGLTHALISVHGMEASHDRNVQRNGSFREAVSALEVFSELGLSLNVNTCLTRLNLAEIAKLREFVASYPVTMHSLTFPEWTENAEIYDDYMVSYQEIADRVDGLIPPEDSRTVFDNLPHCLIRNKSGHISKTQPVHILDGRGEAEIICNANKLYPECCYQYHCRSLGSCPGFERRYIGRRGWQDLEGRARGFLEGAKDRPASSQPISSDSVRSQKGMAIQREEMLESPSRGHLLIVLKPTYRCNANCVYCCSHKNVPPPDLSISTFERLCDEVFPYAQRRRVRSITFLWHGGEPLLRGKDFYARAWQILEMHQDVHIRNLVQTNLLLLDNEWIALFGEHKVGVGTSMDPIGEERIQENGEPQYREWLNRFLLACDAHLPVGIVFTATSGHTQKAHEIYHFFRNLQSMSSNPIPVRFNLVSAAGKAASSLGLDHIPSPEEYGEFLYQLWTLWEKDGRMLTFSPFKEWRARKGLSCEYTGSCQEFIFSMDGTGSIYHCGRFADTAFPYGNLFESSLAEILQHPRRLELQQRRNTLSEGHCKGCLIWEYCKGGCPYHCVVNGGNATHASPLCHAFKLFFEKSKIHIGDKGR